MAQAVDHSNPLTLSRFILAQKDLQKNNDLCILFSSIELACKVIASAVRRAGKSLVDVVGVQFSTNYQDSLGFMALMDRPMLQEMT